MNKRIWIYDLETLNIFTATFIDKDSNEIRVFVLSNSKNEIPQLLTFLKQEVKGLIGYNCLHFDAQILEYIFKRPNCTAEEIKKYAYIITEDNNRRPDVPEWKLKIPHLDLFRALSLSVKAKRTGLKWCEYQMDLDNIEDMPSQGEGDNWEEKVLSYNLNDVIATKELYVRYIKEIQLREALTTREKINLLNSTEPDIAKKIFGKYLAKEMNIPESYLRTFGTERDIVYIKDIIFPYIKFEDEKLIMIKKAFSNLEVKNKDKHEFIINFGGIDITYALGGIHGAVNNKVIKSTDTHIIKSCDVVSFYPNLAIRNKLHPEHIPQEIFCPLYERLFDERRSIPKKDPRNYVLKIVLNSTYGLSNDEFSFLKDRQFTLAICINGQLLLSQLFEKIINVIPDSKLIMCNTDGFEVIIPKEYEQLYYDICKEWEQLTNLELEFVDYKQMVISDVNNYLAIYFDGKTKTKGKYEFENIPLHKNKSHAIIPKSVYEYFVNNVPIEQTIKENTNIFNFCAGVKSSWSNERGKSHYELHTINGSELIKTKLSKTVRYFISNKGQYLFKVYEDGSLEHVEAPDKSSKINRSWKVTYFNKAYYPTNFTDYNIDYIYYISKARKWINDLSNSDTNQLKLF